MVVLLNHSVSIVAKQTKKSNSPKGRKSYKKDFVKYLNQELLS
jgi:hypothetical protein